MILDVACGSVPRLYDSTDGWALQDPELQPVFQMIPYSPSMHGTTRSLAKETSSRTAHPADSGHNARYGIDVIAYRALCHDSALTLVTLD